MTRTEHLLAILAEECDEVSQRAIKALRFSPADVQPGQPHDNADRVYREFAELLAVYEMLHDEAVLAPRAFTPDRGTRGLMDDKRDKVERFLRHSRECGTLTDG